MYSGTTLRSSSGRLIGAHQKLDRVARKALEEIMPDSDFPSIKDILQFEGKNGPDGIKSKSPAQDEPWHYYDPSDPNDNKLMDMIVQHSKNLTVALQEGNMEKASFEAAWQAHAIADGLTPAHHYPLAEHIEALRGEGNETRTSIKDKLVIRSEGDSAGEMLAKNWEVWGARGVMTTHGTYEWGVATTIAPLRLKNGYPTDADCRRVVEVGIVQVFKEAAKAIYDLNMYDRFSRKGWTRQLARETRQILAPLVVKTITLAWYEALQNAEK
jgi:hypothetical protein